MKQTIYSMIAIGLLGATQAVTAADIDNGATLHQKHCQSCHDSGVYTRPNRKVTTPGGLEKQVRRCELTLGLKWFDDDVTDVTAYLNQNYYHFK